MTSPEFRWLVEGAPAERVVLELTEHESIPDYALLQETVNHLRHNGVRLAVDDAGAGFSSFRHILNLQPDIIKLDIALTRGIDNDPARRALGSALLTFGLDAYNTSIVAEGIETEAEFKTLPRAGLPVRPGLLSGTPRPAATEESVKPAVRIGPFPVGPSRTRPRTSPLLSLLPTD